MHNVVEARGKCLRCGIYDNLFTDDPEGKAWRCKKCWRTVIYRGEKLDYLAKQLVQYKYPGWSLLIDGSDNHELRIT